MSLYMRTVLVEWDDPPFADLQAFVERESDYAVRAVDGRGWAEFHAVDAEGTIVLAADLTTGEQTREELDELCEFLAELEGSPAARDAVRTHLRNAVAVVGFQILPSVREQSVEAANAIIGFLEQRPGVLTQVDTVGWYDGEDLILQEPGA
jgi:hypothetical protein